MILITGGMGFIGLHAARRFLDVGQDVVITRFSQWREPGFLKDEYGKRVHIERVDVSNPYDLLGLVQKYSVTHVVHFAVPGLGALTPAEDFRVHTVSLLNILEAARLSSVQRVVVGSSNSVYSGLPNGPFREDVALPVESPPGMTYSGVDPFLRAKEILGLHYSIRTGLDVIFVRLGNIYGPLYHTMAQPWSRMCMAAVQGTQPDFSTSANGIPFEDFSSDYCYVTDCAVGVELVTMASNLRHRLYNIGSGVATSQREIADAVRKTIPGAAIALRSGGGPHARHNAYLDLTRVSRDTGYKPQYDIEQGIAAHIAWLGEDLD